MSRHRSLTNALVDMFSAISSYRKQKQREALIAAQNGKKIKAGPFFSLVDLDFNERTRVAHITFKQEDKYRKIERYVTSNYVRSPIYSDYWSTREKTIKKTIKLTNKELENLEFNPDHLLSDFRFEIVEKLNNLDLVPSWAHKCFLKKEEEKLIETEKVNLVCDLDELDKENNKLKKEKEQSILSNKTLHRALAKEKRRHKRIEKKLARKKNIVLSIVTFGIYSYLISIRHIDKLNSKKLNSESLICKHEKSIKEKENQIATIDSKLSENKQKKDDRMKDYDNKCEEIKNEHLDLISKVKPLAMEIHDTSDFIPLKNLIGVEYEKIKGCYVIHNKEKDKYYVGQSKDVLKRVLRDHFSGTEVKNIIFAQDYFTSQYEDKSSLFEVKIIRCETKDELDETERELIEHYDSFRNGYNGTGGNS